MIIKMDAQGVKEALRHYQNNGDYSLPFILVDRDTPERRAITNGLWNILWNSINPISIDVVNAETQYEFDWIRAEFAEESDKSDQTFDEYIKQGCWYKHIYGGSELESSIDNLIQLCKTGSEAKISVVVELTNLNDTELSTLESAGCQIYLLDI